MTGPSPAAGPVRAAGGVLWRPAASAVPAELGREIALVHRPRYDDWTLPKGKVDAGEHPLAAACREVVEETGRQPVPGRRLPTVSYRIASPTGPVPKIVDYWSMSAADDSGATGEPVDADEVDAVEWLAVTAARDRLTYAHDLPVLDGWAGVPEPTATVLLVRHARAGRRSDPPGDDDTRPLDAAGLRQAAGLAAVLRWYAPERIVSADRARCVQTVRPLAELLDLPVEVDPALSEEAGRPSLVDRVLDHAAAGGRTVLCSQGGVIPAAITALAGADLDLGEVRARKASVWVLSFGGHDGGSALVAADLLPALPPA